MGIIDFVASAGAKLLGKDEEAAAAAQTSTIDVNKVRALALTRLIQDSKLPVKDLAITVNGDRATVRGLVPDQATREKVVLYCGNAATIASVDDQLTVVEEAPVAKAEAPAGNTAVPAATEPASQFYTVVAGDTLSKIAKQYYGNANKYQAIFEANRPMLAHPDKIYPGQVLRIPPAAT
jgi:nucleoid-associated protein YgaU